MKIILLGDTHFGVRQGSQVFIDYQKKFYDFFFDYINKTKIKTVIQVGDEFEHRKQTPHIAMYHAKEMFFDKLRDNQIDYHTIIGNHDAMYKNTLKINTPSLFLQEYGFNIIDEPKTIAIGDSYFCMIPWICDDNIEQAFDEMKNTKADICIGHFEINGFEMHKGQVCNDGLDTKVFKKFQTVVSGHYHHKSNKGNIRYIGTPYELTWHDYGDIKGFYVFDTITHEFEFVENPFKMFYKIEYNDGVVEMPDVSGAFVKVVVVKKDDGFDKFMSDLNTKMCSDIKIIEDVGDSVLTEDLDESIDVTDTLSILKNYVDKMDIDNKDDVNNLLHYLYVEAVNAE